MLTKALDALDKFEKFNDENPFGTVLILSFVAGTALLVGGPKALVLLIVLPVVITVIGLLSAVHPALGFGALVLGLVVCLNAILHLLFA